MRFFILMFLFCVCVLLIVARIISARSKVDVASSYAPAKFRFSRVPLIIIAVGLTAVLLLDVLRTAYFYGFFYGLFLKVANTPVEFVGGVLITVGFMMASHQAARSGIKANGLNVAAMAGIVYAFFSHVLGFHWLVVAGAHIIAGVLMTFGVLAFSKYVQPLKRLGKIFGCLTVAYALHFLTIMFGEGGMVFRLDQIISMMLLSAAALLSIVFAWLTVFKDEKADVINTVRTPNYMEPVPSDTSARPVQSVPSEPLVQPVEPQQPKWTASMPNLLAYDNAKLRKIVEQPKFHNAEVVEKAREILARREAWELIKDLPDDELLEMTMADNGLYEPNIVEAASMELFQRDSQLLREQFMALTPDTVSAIASGASPAPEGIRLAAQKLLSKK